MEARTVSVSFLVLLLFLALLTPTTLRSEGREPSRSELAEIAGTIFPPANLSREETVRGLADWINEALRLNATIGPSQTELPYYGDSMAFFDGFNESMSLPVHGFDFKEPSGTVLTLYYASETREFVAMGIRFAPVSPLGPSDLEDFSVSVSRALGLSLANASYIEYSTGYEREDPNSSGVIKITHTFGTWRETHESFEVHLANQLRVVEEDATHSVLVLEAFRWLEELPPVRFAAAEIVNAASEAANRSTRSRPFSDFSIGLTPNYRNLTWSFLARLSYPFAYPGSCGGEEGIAVLLKAEDLEFQGVFDEWLIVPSCRAPFPLYALASGGAIAAGVALFAVMYVRKRKRGREDYSRSQYGGGRNR